jgi:uroporphyrinogen-III decarboxylase
VPYAWEVTRLAVERGMTHEAVHCAPFSLAVGLRSYPLLIRDMRKDPAFAHELFAWIVDEVLTSYAAALCRYAGINLLSPADAWSAFPNLTPDMMDEWVVPYVQRLQARLYPHGVCVMPCCDYCEERLDKFDKQILWRCFDAQARAAGAPAAFLGMGRWQEYPLEAVAEYVARKEAEGVAVAITAGVNAHLLRNGPVSAIIDNVKRFVDVLGRRTHLGIFLANIPADTAPKHVHAAVAAAHTYGRLPLAKDLDAVAFDVPQRETFDQFTKDWNMTSSIPLFHTRRTADGGWLARPG